MTAGDTITLGPLYLADAEGCAALERLLFPGDDPWSPAAFRAAVRAGHHYLAARDGARLVGYAGLALVAGPPGPEAEVHTIGVHPDMQRRGVGRRLLGGLLQRADVWRATVFLEVRTDNEAAHALYRDTGFEVVGVRRGYYRPSGADAFTMRRTARVGSEK
ncbi:MAG: ribosomal protein S18-alanine N-acetyltransferase [Pseudonocardia sp.]